MVNLDTEPTVEELSKAITDMASGKAPDSDDIPVDLFCQCKYCLLPLMHEILVKYRRKGKVPQNMCDAKIITLNKNKDARTDYNNHRGISLLGMAGKAFARVILPRLRNLAEILYPEAQCVFRSERSTT